MQNSQINTITVDDSSSRDKYYNDHVACIVFGNRAFKDLNEVEARENNQTVDEFVGQGFLFGKYIDFECNKEEWQAQLDDLRKKLSNNNPKFSNLKGIKFILENHGNDSQGRYLSGQAWRLSEYYNSTRFQEVAKIINDCFLSQNKDNKLYFNNWACYGAYFFDDCKIDSNNINPRSNNIYEILSNNFGENRNRVYCSQLIPQSGINVTLTMHPNNNPYRNGLSFVTNLEEDTTIRYPDIESTLPYKLRKKILQCHDKQHCYRDMIPAPESKIYFPLEKWREIVPVYFLTRCGQKDKQSYGYKEEKYYRVDNNTLKLYTGEQAKNIKNNFLNWGHKPQYVPVDENAPIIIYGKKYSNLREYVEKSYNNEIRKLNDQYKLSLKDGKRKYEIFQAERKSGYSLYDQYNQYGNDYPIHY